MMVTTLTAAFFICCMAAFNAKVVSIEMCEDTCDFADDGGCDDSGPGSNFSECFYGTDCSDCGTRSWPYVGETFCSDDCNGFENDGACDDGGPEAPFHNCRLGQDCTDCGERGVLALVTSTVSGITSTQSARENVGISSSRMGISSFWNAEVTPSRNLTLTSILPRENSNKSKEAGIVAGSVLGAGLLATLGTLGFLCYFWRGKTAHKTAPKEDKDKEMEENGGEKTTHADANPEV